MFPESKIVICAAVKLVVEGNAGNPVEHEIREVKVYKVNECPADLLCHARYSIDNDLSHEDQDDVYEPCTLCIHPVSIDVEVRATVQKFLCTPTDFFDLDDTPASPTTFDISRNWYGKMW